MSDESSKPVIGRPFQPGQSGNPAGGRKTKAFRNALLEVLKDIGEDKDGLYQVALSLVKEAKSGNVPAIKELADRIDGKVPNVVQGDDEGGAIKISWEK